MDMRRVASADRQDLLRQLGCTSIDLAVHAAANLFMQFNAVAPGGSQCAWVSNRWPARALLACTGCQLAQSVMHPAGRSNQTNTAGRLRRRT